MKGRHGFFGAGGDDAVGDADDGGNSTMFWPFVQLGDSFNTLVLNATNTSILGAGGAALIVATADGKSFDAVVDAFTAAGLPRAAANQITIPMDAALSFGSDALLGIARASVFAHDAVSWQYKQFPAALFSTGARGDPAARPLFAPPLRPRGTGEAEPVSLERARDALAEAVVRRMHATGRSLVRTLTVGNVDYNATRCVTDPTYAPFNDVLADDVFSGGCLGTDYDTPYLLSDIMHLGSPLANRSTVVVGVNHAITGKAAYCALSLNTASTGGGVASVPSPALEGSAEFWWPEVAAAAPEHADAVTTGTLFAYELRRGPCVSDTPLFDDDGADGSSPCLDVTHDLVPTDDIVAIGWRAYLEAATLTGPDPAELVHPIVLEFNAPARH